MNDEVLEQSIQASWVAFKDAQSRDERRAEFQKMCVLIKQRSPQQIAHMERDKQLLPNQPVPPNGRRHVERQEAPAKRAGGQRASR